jgi:hypothetical protein
MATCFVSLILISCKIGVLITGAASERSWVSGSSTFGLT